MGVFAEERRGQREERRLNREYANAARAGSLNRGGFRAVHPLPAFLYYAGAVLLTMLLFHPVYLATALASSVLLNLLQGGAKRILQGWALYAFTGLFIILVNPLFSHRGSHMLFYFRDNPITLESIVYGGMMALTIWTILLVFVSYRVTITSQKFLYLFSRISSKGALLVMMSLRFAPLLLRRMKQIRSVQRTRGINPFSGPPKKRVSDAMKLLQVLITWSMEEALQTADSMNARGYGSGKRSSFHPFRMSRGDRVILCVLIAAMIVCFAGWWSGFGRWDLYADWDGWRFKPLEPLEYTAYLLFFAIPIAIEGRERWRWLFLN